MVPFSLPSPSLLLKLPKKNSEARKSKLYDSLNNKMQVSNLASISFSQLISSLRSAAIKIHLVLI